MPVLVAGRFVQGFGAGVVPAIGYVAIGRSFREAERPRMFAVLSTAWVVPGMVGPVLAERVSDGVGWRWVFLGLVPLVAVAGSLVVPAMMRLGPLADAPPPCPSCAAGWSKRCGWPPERRSSWPASRRRDGCSSRDGGGLVVGLGPLTRLTPPGTMRAGPGCRP